MQQQRPFGPDDIDEIVVRGSQVTMDHVGWKYIPQGLTSAQLNLPYCVATLLLEGECFVDEFTDAMVADPTRMALSEKVRVEHDDAITKQGSKFRHKVHVEVKLKDGTKLNATVESGRGSEHNFASEADIVNKFMLLATKALPKSQAEELCDKILHLEKLADAKSITALLAIS
jgi:2-methylcitrate dehydratase PrpD